MRVPPLLLATTSAARLARPQSLQDFESRFECGSSLPLLIIVEKLSELREFLFGCLARREGADQQVFHRPVEAPLKQISRELLLRQFTRLNGGVYVRPI